MVEHVDPGLLQSPSKRAVMGSSEVVKSFVDGTPPMMDSWNRYQRNETLTVDIPPEG